ncbi:hypothetical protein FACS1894133_7150 [Clostridia bacterium]|nr:hypothetical protein FACS1894133_7150 [Clostridia bacterium]
MESVPSIFPPAVERVINVILLIGAVITIAEAVQYFKNKEQ